MAEAMLDDLGPVLTRWTMGGPAAGAAPPGWRDVLGTGPAAELRLLGLAGHMLGSFAITAPAGAVTDRPDLPALALPPLPDALRPRSRRLLQSLTNAGWRLLLLEFLAGRGHSLHPADWLPGATESVPALYAPWQDWVAGNSSTASDLPLSAETWDDFGRAARVAAFAALRQHQPAAASALLASKIAGEPADIRMRLLSTLQVHLGDFDRPVLERLATDRAPTVKAIAAMLLRQLGGGDPTANAGDAAELADFFGVQMKGLLRRRQVIQIKDTRTLAQISRRTTLMDSLALADLAGALGLEPAALISAWPWGEHDQVDQPLAAMAARTGTSADIDHLLATLLAAEPINPHLLARLRPRLGPAQQRAATLAILQAGNGDVVAALPLAGATAGLDDVMTTRAGRALLARVQGDAGQPRDHEGHLQALGLLASGRGARQALAALAAAGLAAADPRLDMLRLNAALDDQGDRG